MVHNYEVDLQEQVELSMTGGIKGVRALRVQRDYLHEQLEENKELLEDGENRFNKYTN